MYREDADEDDEGDDEDEDSFDCYGLYHKTNTSKGRSIEPFFVNVAVENKSVCFELDTGCPVTLMSASQYKKLGGAVDDLDSDKTKLRTYTGSFLEVLGNKIMSVESGNLVVQQSPLVVVEESGPNL